MLGFAPLGAVPLAGRLDTLTQVAEPALLTNTQTFYGPTTSATFAIEPSLFTNSQTFYGPVLSQRVYADRAHNTQTFFPVEVFRAMLPWVDVPATDVDWFARGGATGSWAQISDIQLDWSRAGGGGGGWADVDE